MHVIFGICGNEKKNGLLLAGLLVPLILFSSELQLYKSWYLNNKIIYGTKFKVATFLPGPEICGAVLTVTKEHSCKLFFVVYLLLSINWSFELCYFSMNKSNYC